MLNVTVVSVPKKQIWISMRPSKSISKSHTSNHVSGWCRSQERKANSKQDLCGVRVSELYGKLNLPKGMERELFLQQAKGRSLTFP